MSSKQSVILEKEEQIAVVKLNIARANRRLVGLEDEKAEILLSLPQWEEEIVKQEADIKQINESPDDKETKK